MKFFKLTEISYSDILLCAYYDFSVYFFKSFVIIFLQIWSQNLKFSKLIEIWYRGTLLYAYYDFNGYFWKIFISHIFLGNFFFRGGKFGLKIWSSPNWLNFGAGVHYHKLITILMFLYFISFVIHINLGKFGRIMLSQVTGI